MPNIKSAKKRVSVTQAKTLRNQMLRSSLKTSFRKYKAAIADGNKEAAAVAYKDAISNIDRAVSKGILHENNAARKKSRFTLLLNNMQ